MLSAMLLNSTAKQHIPKLHCSVYSIVSFVWSIMFYYYIINEINLNRTAITDIALGSMNYRITIQNYYRQTCKNNKQCKFILYSNHKHHSGSLTEPPQAKQIYLEKGLTCCVFFQYRTSALISWIRCGGLKRPLVHTEGMPAG